MSGRTTEYEVVKEFGFQVLLGLPEDQTLPMRKTHYDHIKIYAEDVPLGTQRLITEDIIEELDEIPKPILRHVSAIVLSPFSCAMDQYLRIRNDMEGKTLATVIPNTGMIIIFELPVDISEVKQRMEQEQTILHEIGHIIDKKRGLLEGNTYFSKGDKWNQARNRDNENRINQCLYNGYVSEHAGASRSVLEDFAGSFVEFVKRPNSFKQQYPNRVIILEGLNVYDA